MLPPGSWGWCSARSPCSSCSTDCARRSPSTEGVPIVSGSPKRQVPDFMAQALAAALEARGRTFRGPRDEGAVGCEILEAWRCAECREHLERVRLPVRGEAQHAAAREAAHRQVDERTLDEAPLVVALLRPGIREQDQDLVHGPRGDLPLEHLDRVVTDDAYVREPPLLEPEQQPADPRTMHLDAEKVPPGMRARERQQVVAVAEADLDGERCVAAEQRADLERLHPGRDAVLRPQRRERALLRQRRGGRARRRGRDPAAAGHEGADRAWMFGPGHVWRESYRAASASLARRSVCVRKRTTARSWDKPARCGSGPPATGSRA